MNRGQGFSHFSRTQLKPPQPARGFFKLTRVIYSPHALRYSYNFSYCSFLTYWWGVVFPFHLKKFTCAGGQQHLLCRAVLTQTMRFNSAFFEMTFHFAVVRSLCFETTTPARGFLPAVLLLRLSFVDASPFFALKEIEFSFFPLVKTHVFTAF